MIRLFHVSMAPEAESRVAHTLRSGYIGQGPTVEEFEAALADVLELPFPPLSTSSCSAALDLALHLIGVGVGSEVISTPMTCSATNSVILRRGAKIVWADVDPISGLIRPEDVGRRMTSRTKAIMAVDWGGVLCDYEALKRYRIPVVQDAAHAFLSTKSGASIAPAGGDYVCWSFQAIKHLTTGDGGALLPPAAELERGRLLRWYGLDRRSDTPSHEQDIHEVGYKYQMNDIAASIGLANLGHVHDWIRQGRENAEWYHERLGDYGEIITLPPRSADPSWWLWTLSVPFRTEFVRHLASAGIEASPVHARNDRYKEFGASRPGELSGVDSFSENAVAIPVGWWLSNEDRERVAGAIDSAVARYGIRHRAAR